MQKYAIVQIDGKQHKLTEGLEIRLNKQNKLNFEVLLYSDGKTVMFGSPFLSDVSIKAKIVRDMKAPKILVGRFKSKSRYQKTKGHRQHLSVVKIESIGRTLEKTVEKVTPIKPVTKSPVKKTTAKTVAKKPTKAKSTKVKSAKGK